MREAGTHGQAAAKVVAANSTAYKDDQSNAMTGFQKTSAVIAHASPGFGAFTKKKVVKHPPKAPASSDPIQNSDAMAAKKTAFARCVRLSMDPESIIGTKPCLEHYSKGLTEAKKRNLATLIPMLC